ncbi:MAG: iron-containing alcohol dehydrogenase [Betaproteobacteria bacterium]|nr:iron-containing alcohol dehydrogenase [Betaproteobacteria bacterium]
MRSGVLVFPAIERIVYGQPAAQALREEAERLGAQRVFLIVSGTMNRTTDEVVKVRAALGSRHAGQYDRMPAHTPRDAVLEAAAAARSVAADLIVTFGGGSCTDAGKMVQLCLRHDIRAPDDFDRFRTVVKADGTRSIPSFDGPTVRQVAIPTTLSAGEFNAQAGCTDTRVKEKHSFRHPLIVPRVTIFDPAPTVHTPLWVWLSSGIRALDHATEGLCSPFSSPVGDPSYVQALKLLSQALRRVKRDPADLEARLDCQLGIWLSMAGRQGGAQMGASHAIGHVLGGTCGVAHGYTSCVMLPHVLRYNRAVNAERQRLVAAAMGHPGEEAGDVIAALVAELGLPGRLSEVGVGAEQFPVIAANALHDSWLHTNPRRITSAEQVLELLEAAA